MQSGVYFKLLQRKHYFRNPFENYSDLGQLLKSVKFSDLDLQLAQDYLENLKRLNIKYTFPTAQDYPEQFYRMKEPPLFFEYLGEPIWKQNNFLAVVGARDIHLLTDSWIKKHLYEFLKESGAGLVSGGARGVDMLSHSIAFKTKSPNLFVLPSGLNRMYPEQLNDIKNIYLDAGATFVSEFECNQKALKSHFFFRNRLIATFSKLCLVAQANLKSGSMLTVHHALENARPIITLSSHPEMSNFAGNLKLLKEGACLVFEKNDLLDFWLAENEHN